MIKITRKNIDNYSNCESWIIFWTICFYFNFALGWIWWAPSLCKYATLCCSYYAIMRLPGCRYVLSIQSLRRPCGLWAAPLNHTLFCIKALHCTDTKQRDGDCSWAFFTKWQLLKLSIICERKIQRISDLRWLCRDCLSVLPEVLVAFLQF